MKALVRGVHHLILRWRAKESLQARCWAGSDFERYSPWTAAYSEVSSIKTTSLYPSMPAIHTGSFFKLTSKRRLLRYMTQLAARPTLGTINIFEQCGSFFMI